MYILLTGTPPFNGKTDREILDRVKTGKYSMANPAFTNISESGKDLLQKMLVYDFKKRPSAEECYNHPWFKKDNKSEKTKLDDTTLDNFKGFFVSVLYFNLFSTDRSCRELFITSWPTIWPVMRKRRSSLRPSRPWILTETELCPKRRSKLDTNLVIRPLLMRNSTILL